MDATIKSFLCRRRLTQARLQNTCAQVAAWRLYYQMKMIGHQTKGVNLPGCLSASGLNDFARNGSILIKQIDSTHSMIAVRDDELLTGWVSNEKQRRKLLAGRDCHM